MKRAKEELEFKIDEIKENNRSFIIRLVDQDNDYEDVEVEMYAKYTNPESPHFTHCELDFNSKCNRTIDGHIKYFEAISEGLRQLKTMLENNQCGGK